MRAVNTKIHYWQVIYYRTLVKLASESSRTYLGIIWWLLEPLMLMMVYYLVFGILIERRPLDFIPYLLVGLVSWAWFSNTVNHASTSIISEGHIITQLRFPSILLPATIIVMDFLKYLFVLLVLMIFLFFYGISPDYHHTALILVIAVQLLFSGSCAILFAGIIPFVPDLRHVVPQLLLVMMFLSGIFYYTDVIPDEYLGYFFLNPMARLINEYREILLSGNWPNFAALGYLAIESLILLFVGCYILSRADSTYPRLILER